MKSFKIELKLTDLGLRCKNNFEKFKLDYLNGNLDKLDEHLLESSFLYNHLSINILNDNYKSLRFKYCDIDLKTKEITTTKLFYFELEQHLKTKEIKYENRREI